MDILTVVLAVLAAAPFALLGTAKITGRADMPERATHLGFTPAAYQRIGVLEVLGAAALLIGLALPALGVIAAVCLLVLVVSAAVLHLRNGDGAPGVAIVCAVLVLAYGILRVVTW